MASRSDYRQSIHVPEHPEVPDDVRLSVLAKYHEQGIHALEELKKAHREDEDWFDAWRERLVEAAGGEKAHRKIRERLRRDRATMDWLKWPNPPMDIDPDKTPEELRRELSDYLEKRGVTGEVAEAIRHDLGDSYWASLERLDTEMTELTVRPEPDQWVLHAPPYDGYYSDVHKQDSGSMSAVARPYFKWGTIYDWGPPEKWGNIFGEASVGNCTADPGECDRGHVRMDTEIGFWHQMEHSGKLEAKVMAKGPFTRHGINHSVYRFNMLGFSSSDASSRATIYLKTNGVRVQPGRCISKLDKSGTSDGFWHYNIFPCNRGPYWIFLESELEHTEGEWVWVSVGQQTWVRASADDMHLNSGLSFDWFVSEVHLGRY